jgi:hypothetical protein
LRKKLLVLLQKEHGDKPEVETEKRDFGEEIYNQDKRRLALERTMNRIVPEDAKNFDFVKLIREDRDR